MEIMEDETVQKSRERRPPLHHQSLWGVRAMKSSTSPATVVIQPPGKKKEDMLSICK